ncbi:MAG TPA: polyprenyl synthetase family protein [Acidimicrobiia bacterium]|jgi:geranylgeranyl diphosphate synthase type I
MDRGGAPFPAALAAVANRAEAKVSALLDTQRAAWTPIDERLAAPIDALAQLVAAGGKRIRPALCAVAYAGVGGAGGLDADQVVAAGAALELLHTFALVHDDVMDGSETRRGVDAVHRGFVRQHEVSQWRGESRRFGEGMAILVGDIAYVLADVLLRDAPQEVHTLWDELRLELCIGQSLDLIGAAEATFELALAQRIVSYKSAKYTVERPLHLGATLAGAGPEVTAALSAVGLPLGQAFQLRDDELGVFGDEVVTGKPVGDDLREGKPTPMLAMAHERASRVPGAERVLAMVGTRDLGEREIKEIQDVLVDTGALVAVEDEIERLVTEAVAAIDSAPLDADAASLLADLARYIAWRDH